LKNAEDLTTMSPGEKSPIDLDGQSPVDWICEACRNPWGDRTWPEV